ncbi:DUF3298 and DUF4163 domain-containing protein [Flagellimonas nanhaiensis]|uniref:DUF3298/DUF4163 domain-containing protein n=1 Tax=Flagellimonas nanhaiensis TaxID=2292706 RepID=A0A371JQ32_9FLAO|nr:DUF3298 and DUF4163 domain-containing protein [Allomuricauda nanhaiensis]RDY59634.1 DUF3298/DUF4163 domain-containing protein [Allomuricauda nanhaiensis]
MKKIFLLLFLLLPILGCENGNNLTFEPIELHGKNCAECPKINIDIPRALDELAVSTSINRALEEEIISLLSFDEEKSINTMQEAMASFTKSYNDLRLKFPDETVGWEAEILGKVIYEDNTLLTIELNSYTFTGGAHGYSSSTLLNFDKVKGSELENWELFEDYEGFQKFAETQFRIQEDVPQDENINATGFMFEKDTFHLAENIGYTKNGVQLIYNQYEVASYADGPIVLNLPYSEINQYLKRKVEL